MAAIIATEADVAAGVEALRASCPVMAAIIPLAGQVPLRRREPGFGGLCRIIVGQQVSVASANAIWSRFEAAFQPFGPEALLQASHAELAGVGLSRRKIAALRAAAAAVASGDLPLAALPAMDADAVRAALTGVKGVGPWTADVFALFCLGHADAFAPGDLALQEAARIAFAREARPGPGELEALSRRWRPHRGVAARVLWAYYAALKRREGVGA